MAIFEKRYGIMQGGCLSPAEARNSDMFPDLDNHFKQLRNELNLNSIDWKSIAAFLSRPYFSRIWILQEASANLAIETLCGDTQIPFIAITSIARCICRSLQSEPEIAESCNFHGKGYYHASLMFTKFSRCKPGSPRTFAAWSRVRMLGPTRQTFRSFRVTRPR